MAASKYQHIELGVDEARRCPHCAREGAVSRRYQRGLSARAAASTAGNALSGVRRCRAQGMQR